MVLWCQTVISSVQGRTISTIARMSRLFGISKTDWAHSSSLPDSENPRDRTAEHMENRNKWAGRSKDRERERESAREEGESSQGDTTRGSYQCLQPTHCRSRFGGASAAEPRSRRALSAGHCWSCQQEPQGLMWKETCNTEQRPVGRESSRILLEKDKPH